MKPIISPFKLGVIRTKPRWHERILVMGLSLWSKQCQHYRKLLREQIEARGAVVDSAWGSAERCEVARSIEAILAEKCWCEPFTFHPDDPAYVVMEWEVGDLSEAEAIMDIEDMYDAMFPNCDIERIMKEEATFGEFVDYVLEKRGSKVWKKPWWMFWLRGNRSKS
jgi:hypothetical protein